MLPFVQALEEAGHTVSVIVPDTQRSWIGKAHIVGQDVQATHYWPPASNPETHTASASRSDDGKQPWVLVNSTPASCAQLGLSEYFFQERGRPDIVISGPNYGRNTTAAFALSSGTLGGALEAAVCGVRAVAVSFAYERGRPATGAVVDEACAHAARVVRRLCEGWRVAAQGDGDEDVPELFSVNVPLVEGVSGGVVRWTWMLGNKWRGGSLYKVVGREAAGADGLAGAAAAAAATTTRDVAEGRAGLKTDKKEQEDGAVAAAAAGPAPEREADRLAFRWQPTFADIWATVDSSGAGNDGLAVKNHETSVTPLRANFAGLYGRAGFEGVLKL